ncbi:MAG: addiction module toxin RelE [Actinobacteria bacterium]|nr:MAG: addiction module toxin RelE [Actinomycetota bacterium]
MPRALRPPIENGIYHVTARGNRKADIYFDVADRQYFLQLVGRVVERCGWMVHAYCLMTNHYHLVVATPAANISTGMQRVNSMYASWVNWRYDLCGHLFGDRFDSQFVEADAHFLQACRYVVLNPVRAGICDDAGEYRWSSYRATLGTELRPGFLRIGAVLDAFGGGAATAPTLYRAFVDAGAVEAIRLRRRRADYVTAVAAA